MNLWDDSFDNTDFDGDDGPVEVSCKTCGKHGLQWDESTGKWVLIEADGEPHVCRQRDVLRHAAASFEDCDK